MPPIQQQETAQLLSWAELSDACNWTGLLIGNGASIAVHARFRYDSLFGVARTDAVEHALSPDDIALFDAFDTVNFEQILAALKTTRRVLEALGTNEPLLRSRYESIQRALFQAIHAVHVPWVDVADDVIPRLHDVLRDYRFIYSTNYDLLIYWASLHNGGDGFLDFMWSDGTHFDAFDTAPFRGRDGWTRVLFPHGGIHLRRLQNGNTRKATSAEGNLLDQFETAFEDEETPLLVSEGDSEDKLRSINSSDYLTFAHRCLIEHAGGLVIFGNSLAESDDHIVRPISKWTDKPVAVAVRPADDATVIERKALFRLRLAPNPNVFFFDASTHPLSDLRAAPPG